ncbi:MAG: spore germination protein [Eubacterium sp.]|nr:spore germination protein [Eubacterium sp.]
MGKEKLSQKPVRLPFDESTPLSDRLSESCTDIRALFQNTADVIIKYAEISGIKISVMTCEGMVSKSDLANLIYRPLIAYAPSDCKNGKELLESIASKLLIAEEQKQTYTVGETAQLIMSGFAVILADGADFALGIGVQGYEHRMVEEPSTHINLRASREGFIELIRTNMSMVRRRMKSPTLVMNMIKVGSRSNTDVCICYLSDRADKKMVTEITGRLKSLPLSTILCSDYLQAFLEKSGGTVFAQVTLTERPDTFVSKLYEGRVGIIVDGTPFALIVPGLFIENFHTMDDYTHHPYFSAFVRALRFIAFLLAAFLPGLYVALCNFNPELFRTPLLLNVYSSIQTTAYPVFAECLIMYILYEIMREAGLRLPKSVGHAVSIVGGLVIGEITVTAGLMSAPVVLIIAATGLCSFAVPDLYETCMILRLMFILAGGVFGLFGITVAATVVLLRLCAKSSYGIPYLAPFAPTTLKSIIRDSFYRRNWQALTNSDITVSELSKSVGSERNDIENE